MLDKPHFKLGKKPARPGAIKFKLSHYTTGTLPTAPSHYGHQSLVNNWGMLGNDQYGDCVFAGAGHEHMLWNAEGGKTFHITTDNVLQGYSEVTGFNKNDPNSDQGTDMELAAKWRRTTGLPDASGLRHKVGAYLDIQSGNIAQIKQAAYLFSAVGIGIEFPASAMDQFNAGRAWSVVSSSPIKGGHYVPVVGYDSRYIYVITWGKVQKCTYAFIRKYMDEGIVYLSNEFLNNLGQSLEGFNLTQLQADLNQL